MLRMDPYILHSLLARLKFLQSSSGFHQSDYHTIYPFPKKIIQSLISQRSELHLHDNTSLRPIWVFPWLWQTEEKASRTASGVIFWSIFQVQLNFLPPQKWPRPGSKSLSQFVAGNTDLVYLEVGRTSWDEKCREKASLNVRCLTVVRTLRLCTISPPNAQGALNSNTIFSHQKPNNVFPFHAC